MDDYFLLLSLVGIATLCWVGWPSWIFGHLCFPGSQNFIFAFDL